MKYKVEKWEPIKNLYPKYTLEDIDDDLGETIFHLSCKDKNRKNLEVSFFSGSLCSYKVCNLKKEGFEIKNLIDSSNYDLNKWTFFEVKNSEYNKDLSEGSYGFMDPDDFVHFLLVCSNAIIDIVDHSKDNLEFLEK